MKKNNENHQIKEWFQKNTTWLIGILFLLLNIYLTTKLAPLVQNIEINKINIAKAEERIKEIENLYQDGDEKIWEELKYIRIRVDNIYNIVK